MDELTKHNSQLQNCCECNYCEWNQFDDENHNTKITINKDTCAESYLKEKRILELIHFMLSKVVAVAPEKPVLYLEKLLDDCIGFLAGRSTAPTLYETRHFEAVVKSFDPCQRGWLNSCQVRQFYEIFGSEVSQKDQENNITADRILEDIKKKHELALRGLLLAEHVNKSERNNRI